MRLVACLLLAHVMAACAAAAAGAQGSTRVRWGDVLRQPDAWYGQPEAKAVAESVRRYQRSRGGWPKDIDMTQPPAPGAPVPAGGAADSTIDNGATDTPR